MDSTIQHILVKDSFNKIKTNNYPISLPLKVYKNEKNTYNDFKAIKIKLSDTPKHIFCNLEQYNYLQELKSLFDEKDAVVSFIEARNITNPFETIGNSKFINRAAVKLANIDAIFKISGDVFDFINQRSEYELIFCDIAAGPGGFTQYLQWRYPNSFGVGMTLKGDLDWNTNIIDTRRFEIDYGLTNDGDLYSNWKYFKSKLAKDYNNKIHLMTADGGIETDEYHRQEFVSSRLLACQAVIATEVKQGGNFVLKMFDTVTKFSADVIYCLSLAFEQIVLFKPLSSRPANSERYLVCYNRKKNIAKASELLERACDSFTDDTYLQSFLNELPEDFNKWLKQSNDDDISSQIYFAKRILYCMAGEKYEEIKINPNKALLYWNLPDNTLTYKKGKLYRPDQTNIML